MPWRGSLRRSTSYSTNDIYIGQSRLFATSATRSTHYDTLSVPKNASRAQIKSAFYQLSKELHPDTHPNDPKAREKFHKITEAYSILGDDRQRRAYDRSLAHSDTHYQSPYQGHSYDSSSAYEFRQAGPGARHAWQRTSSSHGTTWTYTYTSSRMHPQSHTRAPPSEDPFASPFVRRATGRRGPTTTQRQRDSRDEKAEQRWKQESTLMRFVQVAGIFVVVMYLAGGGVASV